jgi:hypothetical protein
MSLKIPKLVSDLSYYHEAWIVGSAANPENTEPRDYDVLVPFSKWQEASSLIPPGAKPNHFGGWKCISEGVEVDVFPGELTWLLKYPQTQWIYNYATNIRYYRGTK